MNREEFEQRVKDARELLNNGKFKEAEKKLLKSVEQYEVPTKTEDEATVLHCGDILQFLTYVNIFGNKQKFVWDGGFANLAYNMLGFIYVDLNNIDDAFKYLMKAVELNPMDVGSRLEIAECYLRTQKKDEFLDTMKETYKYVCTPLDFAKYLRKLGFFYIEEEMYKIAFSLYRLSLIFENSPLTINELQYIREKVNDENYDLEMNDIINTLIENELPVAPSEPVLGVLFGMYKDEELQKRMPNAYEEVKRRLYVFTGDERFKNNV